MKKLSYTDILASEVFLSDYERIVYPDHQKSAEDLLEIIQNLAEENPNALFFYRPSSHDTRDQAAHRFDFHSLDEGYTVSVIYFGVEKV